MRRPGGQARLEKALARLPELEAIKTGWGKTSDEARVSTTDAEATTVSGGPTTRRSRGTPTAW